MFQIISEKICFFFTKRWDI